MKFELVEPADWDSADEQGESADEAREETGDSPEENAEAGEEGSETSPTDLLRTATAELKTHVRASAAQLGPVLARLRECVVSLDSGVSGSGHGSGVRPPSSFRAERFGASGR